MEVIERLKKQYGEDLLFVGARGSNCVGLQMEGSDLDILAIVNRQMKKCKELQDDVAVYGLDLADERIMVGAFNLVEALLSPLYIADSYRSLYDKYLEIIFTEEYNYMFRSHLYGAIKNFIKLYYKKDGENRYKHIAMKVSDSRAITKAVFITINIILIILTILAIYMVARYMSE